IVGASVSSEFALELPWTDCAALSITSATSSAWDIMDRCPPLTWMMWDCARWAMKSCAHGGMTLSSVPSAYQDGIDFQAGAPDLMGRALRSSGRWVDARTAPCLLGRSLAKHEGNTLCLTNRSKSPGVPGIGTKSNSLVKFPARHELGRPVGGGAVARS